MIHHVLVPLDGSQLAEKALAAARQVVRSGGQITLITAVPHIPAAPVPASGTMDTEYQYRDDFSQVRNVLNHTRDYLENTAQKLRLQGYQVSIEVKAGEPAEAIIGLAEKLHVDMVVMSTHGRSGLSRFLFGSITLKVLEAASVPVLVIPNREREEVQEPAISQDKGAQPAT
jgi:nucleotide-binding universal stress UspA family protein